MDRKQQPNLVTVFGKHLLGIAVYYRLSTDEKTTPKKVMLASGTLLILDGHPFLLTAGHVIEDVNKLHTDPFYADAQCALIDNMGHDAVHEEAIPFAWVGPPKLHFDQDGLDFGIVMIDAFYLPLLDANGVAAVSEENWAHQHQVQFEAYFALGFPQELSANLTDSSGGVLLRAAAVPLERISIDQLPDGRPLPSNPIFVAQVGDDVPLQSTKGMSGGPILGIRWDPDGVRYWIVAITYAWYGGSRVVVGSLLTSFAPALLDGIRKATAQLLESSERRATSA